MTPSEISKLLDAVKQRLEAAKIEFGDDSVFDDEQASIDLTIQFPCGPQTRTLFIWDEDALSALADIKFEDFTLLGNFAAVADRANGRIEAVLTAPNEPKNVFRRRMLLDRLGLTETKGVTSRIRLQPAGSDYPKISIGPLSAAAKVLTQSVDHLGLSLTISVGSQVNHDMALALLEQLSNSLLFNIDVVRGVHVALLRRSVSRRRGRRPKNLDDLQFPEYDYEKAPMALYWYARSADSMPLLQYLAFYQVIEFYYPIYFNAEMSRRIRLIIKQPTFRVERETDIARIVSVMKGAGQTVGGEREQLKATLRECLTDNDVEDFLAEEADRGTFFLSKAKGITSNLVNPQNRQVGLAMQVAERIYDIRCRIVHTKSDHNDGEVELLLPYSSEAERLGHDIDLIRFVARKVLTASCKRLELSM